MFYDNIISEQVTSSLLLLLSMLVGKLLVWLFVALLLLYRVSGVTFLMPFVLPNVYGIYDDIYYIKTSFRL